MSGYTLQANLLPRSPTVRFHTSKLAVRSGYEISRKADGWYAVRSLKMRSAANLILMNNFSTFYLEAIARLLTCGMVDLRYPLARCHLFGMYLTNRFHFAVRLYSDNAKMTSKHGNYNCFFFFFFFCNL